MKIDCATTIMEGIKLYGMKLKPFIVKKTNDIIFDYKKLKENIIKENINIYTTDKDTLEYVENINLKDKLNEWEHDVLKYNFTDSNISNDIYNYNNININEIKKFGVGLTMCSSNTYTPFHIDSTNKNMGGGGWVYLYKGTKKWNIIEFFDAINNIYNQEGKHLIDVNCQTNNDNDNNNCDKVNNCSIYQCEISEGDFIYFPPGWAHQVITSEKSIGLNGYMLLESDYNYIENINKWYNETSNYSDCGLLHRPLSQHEINTYKKLNNVN
jgi:hypothetical protein